MKVGMSVSVELMLTTEPQLVIPIVAVQQKGNLRQVRVLDAAGKAHTQAIVTGLALADRVVVNHGLVAGDIIAYD